MIKNKNPSKGEHMGVRLAGNSAAWLIILSHLHSFLYEKDALQLLPLWDIVQSGEGAQSRTIPP